MVIRRKDERKVHTTLGRKELSELKISYNGKPCHSDSEDKMRKKKSYLYIIPKSVTNMQRASEKHGSTKHPTEYTERFKDV